MSTAELHDFIISSPADMCVLIVGLIVLSLKNGVGGLKTPDHSSNRTQLKSIYCHVWEREELNLHV